MLVTGYAQTFTGDGLIQSANGQDQATFGFTFNTSSVRAKGAYHDQEAGVDLEFEGVLTAASPDSQDQCMTGLLSYRSLDDAKPGQGILFLIARHDREPEPGTGDGLTIVVIDGPYAGYSNSGPVVTGNRPASD